MEGHRRKKVSPKEGLRMRELYLEELPACSTEWQAAVQANDRMKKDRRYRRITVDGEQRTVREPKWPSREPDVIYKRMRGENMDRAQRDRPPVQARLRIRSERVESFTDRRRVARYAVLEVAAETRVQAVDCWARVDVSASGSSFLLHWAGPEYTPEETTARRILITPGMPARLDLAVAIPAVNVDPDEAVAGTAAMSGQLTVMTIGDDVKYVPEPRWDGEGCWLGQPAALYNPDPRHKAYQPPGEYGIRVTVGCAGGEGDSRDYILVSPRSWEGLRLSRA